MKTLSYFFKLNDVIPDNLRSCFVYKYTCDKCSESYIGKSTKHFFFRKCQHLGISDRTGKKLQSPAFSNIRNHCMSLDHELQSTNFEILGFYKKNDVAIAESLWSHKDKPSIGNNETSVPLHCVN